MQNKELYEKQKYRVFATVLASSFSMGLSNPFLGVYAARLGASPIELGFFHSFINFSGNIMQVIWGEEIQAYSRSLNERFGSYVDFHS